MSKQDEQLYGREGIEQAQGYEPMQMAVPDPDPEPAIDSDSAIAKHLQRPAPPEPIERTYNDVRTGEPRDGTETVEMDRAAEDLSKIRATERLELDKERNADLHEALDYLQQEQSVLAAAAAPQPAQPQQQEPQPDYQPQYTAEAIAAMSPEQQNALYAASQAQIAEADRQIADFLQNPAVRERIEGEFNTVKTQAAAEVQQARAAYQKVITQNATAGLAALNASFPELAGMSAEQITGRAKVDAAPAGRAIPAACGAGIEPDRGPSAAGGTAAAATSVTGAAAGAGMAGAGGISSCRSEALRSGDR